MTERNFKKVTIFLKVNLTKIICIYFKINYVTILTNKYYIVNHNHHIINMYTIKSVNIYINTMHL